jgi:hypothetical protein
VPWSDNFGSQDWLKLFNVDSGRDLASGPVEQASGSTMLCLSFERTVAKLYKGNCPNGRVGDQRLPMMGEGGK